jgi:ubiquinone/menaquinone biosynthesis C-methylase UbiE
MGEDRRYDGEADGLRAPERVRLLELERVVRLSLEGLAVDTILDVGTGSGIFAEAFSRLSTSRARVMGVDANERLLVAARAAAPTVSFVVGVAEALPFADSSFDLVFLGHVLHEADNQVRALSEACRVAVRRVAILEWPYREEPRGPRLAHRLSPERLAQLARQAGVPAVEHIELSHMDLYRLTPA